MASSTLVISAHAVEFLPGVGPVPLQINPSAPSNSDIISFSHPLDGFTYGNACEATIAFGGTPFLDVDQEENSVRIMFAGPVPPACPAVFDPVHGVGGQFGPLSGGEWTLSAEQFEPLNFSVVTPPTDFLWDNPSGGFWDADNWNPEGFPNGNNQTANFLDVITSPSTVVIDLDVTLKGISFDSTVPYNISGLGTLTFEIEEGHSKVTGVSGDHQFQAVVSLHNETLAFVESGARLTFNNTLFLNGNTLTKTGSGVLAVRNEVVAGGGTINVQQGTLSGAGTIEGDVQNGGGTISPGSRSSVLSVVPEPNSLLICLFGIVILAGYCPRRRNRRTIQGGSLS